MASDCTGCAQSQRRFRSTTPRLWCTRFHTPALARCIDYRSKPSALEKMRALMTRSRSE